MTQQNMVVDAAKGLVAIYSGPVSETVEDNPLDHLDITTFNSKLDYIGFTRVRKTYTIPARSSTFFAMERVNLGAHGKGFTPICLAVLKAWPNGDGTSVDVPLMGGVLLDFYGQRPGDGGALTYLSPAGDHIDRWSRPGPSFFRRTRYDNAWQEKSLLVGAGADGTDLFLWYEQCVRPKDGDGASYPALALTIDFYVGDRSIDGQTGDAAAAELFQADTTGVIMSTTRLTATGATDGGFDSDRNYLHSDQSSPLFPIATAQASQYDNGVVGSDSFVRAAMSYAPNWSYEIIERFGSPTVPAWPPPTPVGLSL